MKGKKKVVVIGGGNGSAASVIALKQNLKMFDISAVVSMADSGRLNGKLRKKYGILPPADILRAALAMSVYDYTILKEIFFARRFTDLKKINGFNLGYLYFLGAWRESGDFVESLRAFEQSMKAVGRVYPNTLKQTDLVGELINGRIIRTEGKLDVPSYDRNLKIKKVYLEPKVKAYTEGIKQILTAEYIILGPGSLYTSVIAALLPKGIKEAIEKNKKAKLIYVVGNARHTRGETGPEDVAGCAKTIENYLPRPLDLIIYSGNKLNKRQRQTYKVKGWSLLVDNGELLGKKLLRAPYERENGGICAIKLGKILKKVCK